MATEKKITRVESKAQEAVGSEAPAKADWKPTAEAKSKATTNRILAAILWAVAIGAELFTIFWLLRNVDIKGFMVWLIILLVVIAALAICGSLLWKKANKYDPASKADPVRFFIQNQLGLIITAIAFIPLIVLIFLNKDMDGKQKGIAGALAILLCLAAGAASFDWNPPSTEEYAEKTARVQALTGQDLVYWTAQGGKYHLYDDCQHINTTKTEEIFEGTVGQAFAEIKKLDREVPLCKTCESKYLKEHPDVAERLNEAADNTEER